MPPPPLQRHGECHETKNNITKVKTKTESIIKQLADTKYKREPRPEILQMTKHETKTIVTARYRMLQCGKNFKGTMKEICDTCNTIDDENHRLNDCIKWRTINLYDSAEKTDFYSICLLAVQIFYRFPNFQKLVCLT